MRSLILAFMFPMSAYAGQYINTLCLAYENGWAVDAVHIRGDLYRADEEPIGDWIGEEPNAVEQYFFVGKRWALHSPEVMKPIVGNLYLADNRFIGTIHTTIGAWDRATDWDWTTQAFGTTEIRMSLDQFFNGSHHTFQYVFDPTVSQDTVKIVNFYGNIRRISCTK